MEQKKSTQEIPQRTKQHLFKVLQAADAKRKYRWAIDVYEHYRKVYSFDDALDYRLALLYDHLVIFKIEKLLDKTKKQKFLKKYLKKAENIYRAIVKRNPDYHLAFHGLSRVYQARAQYRKAIMYAKRAYALLKKLPKKRRGVLGIGNVFLLAGDHKNAEKWFKKELNDLGKNHLGANANVMMFYLQTNNLKKGLPYALKTEKLLTSELAKPIYRGVNTGSSNKTIGLLRKRIDKIKQFNSHMKNKQPTVGGL
ncbi:MAG: hypothetical protein AAB652_02745 [Patescibacteria group bacterium]